MAIRALLLDHDGTLVDSYEGIAKCMRLMCRDLGVPEMSDAENSRIHWSYARGKIHPTVGRRHGQRGSAHLPLPLQGS